MWHGLCVGAASMGARTYRELEVWQLAEALRLGIVKHTTAVPIRQDFRFCSEVQAAARSVAANIAEGFTRFTPAEFLQFLRYAHGSLAEVQTYVHEMRHRSLVPAGSCDELETLAARTGAALTALIRYLRTDDAKVKSRRF